MKTLVVFAHPSVEGGSIANKVIIDAVSSVEGVEVRNLYQMYPDFKIDVEAEQKALAHADLIVFQFPFYWYSVPGILKEWLDKVFLYGFAYGSTGDKLKGKEFLISTTVGGAAEMYQEGGANNFPILDLLKPLEQTSNLAGMNFNAPIVTHGMIFIPDVYGNQDEVEKRAGEHADQLVQFIREKG